VNFTFTRAALWGLLLTLAAGPAHALLMVYTDRAAWQAALGGTLVVEDFNALPQASLVPGLNTVGKLDIELTGAVTVNRIIDASGLLASDGSQYFHGGLDFVGVEPTSLITLLPGLVRGFGADWTSTVTGGGLLLRAGGETVRFGDYLPGAMGNGFLGIIADVAFARIELDTVTGAAEQFGVDNVAFGEGGPFLMIAEPATLALMLPGVVALRRRGGAQRGA
jgi:hypothetical protein